MARPSRVPALIDSFLERLQAADGLTGVQVVDGPLVSDSAKSEWVFVGYDGDPEGDFTTSQATRQWAGLGAKAQNEDILLTGSILVRQGSTKVKPCRDRTFAIFAELETVVRTDPSLGLGTPTVCQLTEHIFHTEQTTTGIQGRLPFTLTCSTRI